jgi:hypothetical protein
MTTSVTTNVTIGAINLVIKNRPILVRSKTAKKLSIALIYLLDISIDSQ